MIATNSQRLAYKEYCQTQSRDVLLIEHLPKHTDYVADCIKVSPGNTYLVMIDATTQRVYEPSGHRQKLLSRMIDYAQQCSNMVPLLAIRYMDGWHEVELQSGVPNKVIYE